ncbi:MAG: helix-turn-helix domain-containing protein [Candidatus Aenigmarchaeota archaeon]|nr:helix-turn-helix domain-containing protein [Candidatus Aenigmarchaeota archaeon]
MLIRRGKEFYNENYKKVLALHKQGLSAAEIARQLGISYSCVYHWVKGIRKPNTGNVENFIGFLKKHGPSPAIEIKSVFPKHNELFLVAQQRKMPVKRRLLRRKFREYRTWYYLEGQEDAVKSMIKEMLEKYNRLRNKLVFSLLSKD